MGRTRDGASIASFEVEAEAVALDSQTSYEAEIAHFVGCLATGRPPAIATIQDAVNTTRLLEAERESMETGLGEGVEGR